MKYFKIVAFLLLIQIQVHSQIREGALIVNFSDYSLDYNFNKSKTCLKLYLGDSLKGERCITANTEIRFKKLKPGKYDLIVFVNDIKEITYFKVDVDTLAKSYLTIAMKEFDYRPFDRDRDEEDFKITTKKSTSSHGYHERTYSIFNVLKGIPLDKKNNLLDAEFQASGAIGFVMAKSKYFNIPFEFGFNGGFAHIRRDTSLFLTKPKNNERYAYFNCSMALLNTINLFYDSLSVHPKCIVQYGIGYNFPFMYNHVGIEGDFKITNRSISNYNNFFLMARVMFRRFGVHAEYNLNPHLKTAYPEPAVFRIGLCLKTD